MKKKIDIILSSNNKTAEDYSKQRDKFRNDLDEYSKLKEKEYNSIFTWRKRNIGF